jgi:hypothetical protein
MALGLKETYGCRNKGRAKAVFLIALSRARTAATVIEDFGEAARLLRYCGMMAPTIPG